MTGCIEWTGTRNARGYGIASRASGTGEALAHRDAWAQAFGPIPQGQVLLHSCDNPPCVSLAHLSLGTQGDNVRDCVTKGRLMSAANVAARVATRKLTDDQIRLMRERYAEGGISTRALGELFGVSGGFAHHVVTGQRRTERQQSEDLAGPRCHHDQIEAWCSWCKGLDESGIDFELIGKGE